ncbi:hypothetical protein [Anaeromicrobium sediminis]|uniref:hypothetical protein n=1 Tax=Anaeromicrobium sediminis TaxID=1478221 RepID=UPI0015957882|nr:hypothetical protein [Anaeromicrobium sediminis]
MSFFYNILYSGYDSNVLEDAFINEHKRILDTLQIGSKILDSSCGNGLDAKN